MKLTTHEEIRQYVIQTIRGGNKKRIIAVMNRYAEWLKEQQNSYKNAQTVFKDMIK